jgi:hypothetical protein
MQWRWWMPAVLVAGLNEHVLVQAAHQAHIVGRAVARSSLTTFCCCFFILNFFEDWSGKWML